MAFVSELNTYPIKSGGAMTLQTAEFTPSGIMYDRWWMAADENGKHLSQREHKELALITPAITEGHLSINAPGMENIAIDLADTDYPKVAATVHGQSAPAIAQNPEASEWLGAYLHRDNVQFLRFDPDGIRLVKPQYRHEGVTNQLGFADGASLLLGSMASHRALLARMDDPVLHDQSRANIWVDGDDLTAYEEDYWQDIRLGNLEALVAWGCARCIIQDTSQKTAERTKRVLKALQGFRKGVDAVDPTNKGVFNCVNVLFDYKPGLKVSVGDELTVVERSDEPNVL